MEERRTKTASVASEFELGSQGVGVVTTVVVSRGSHWVRGERRGLGWLCRRTDGDHGKQAEGGNQGRKKEGLIEGLMSIEFGRLMQTAQSRVCLYCESNISAMRSEWDSLRAGSRFC